MVRAVVGRFCLLAAGFCAAAVAVDAAGGQREESAVTLDLCPAPVQAALTKAATDGTITRIRKVVEGAVVSYRADIEIAVDSSGQPLRPAPADPVLAPPVTLNVTAARLQDVCKTLSALAGVPVTCGSAFADKPVTLSLQDAPFGEALKKVAEQTGTRADLRAGGYRFRTGGR